MIESIPVTHGYLEAAGLTPRDGRLPTDAEFQSGAPVVVVTETVSKQYWPGRRAVGQSLVNHGRPFRVVGVADARYLSLDLDAQGEIYWPVAAMPQPRLGNLMVRFGTGRDSDVTPFLARLSRLCPTCWIRRGHTLTDALSDSIRPRRFSAWLFSAFGLAAVVITGVGVLGLVAMTTSRRTREIGIRMALGARAATVTWHIVGEQIQSVALGLVLGGLIAAYVVRFVVVYLYKTPMYDPWSWVAAVVALLVVAMAGTFIPARRASRVDPVRALTVE